MSTLRTFTSSTHPPAFIGTLNPTSGTQTGSYVMNPEPSVNLALLAPWRFNPEP